VGYPVVSDSYLKLASPNTMSYMSEVFEQRIALADYTLKSHFAGVRRVLGEMPQ
jgi:hypothetical protein